MVHQNKRWPATYPVYHAAKFHRPASTHTGDVRYKMFADGHTNSKRYIPPCLLACGDNNEPWNLIINCVMVKLCRCENRACNLAECSSALTPLKYFVRRVWSSLLLNVRQVYTWRSVDGRDSETMYNLYVVDTCDLVSVMTIHRHIVLHSRLQRGSSAYQSAPTNFLNPLNGAEMSTGYTWPSRSNLHF